MKTISIIIPALNEEKGLGLVIDQIPKEELERFGYNIEVIVIDNNSQDKTAEVARKRNAKVIVEQMIGKGRAIKRGFQALSAHTDYVIMMDGDNTYKPHEILRLIEPLEHNFCDVIVGSRLGGKMKEGSFKFQNRIANWIYTFLVRYFYKANVTDVLSGYFAWKKEVVDTITPHIESEGFAIEIEMITKMVRLGYELYSVPITYDRREGTSKISAVKDGLKILYMFTKNLFWSPRDKKRIVSSDTLLPYGKSSILKI